MRFAKVKYTNRDTGKENINVSKRVEYFLHYWNFVFQQQKSTGLLLIHHIKLESHRSLIHKIDKQLNENKSQYGEKLKYLFIEHPYFQVDNPIIRKSTKTKSEIANFKNNFNKSWFNRGIRDKRTNKENQLIILNAFTNIKKLILRNYLNRLLNYITIQLNKDNPVDEDFKKHIQFLINAIIVELYFYGFSLEYIRKLADIIVFPNSHKNQFPFDKTFRDFTEPKLYDEYKKKTLQKINLHEQIACIKNLVDNKKYPKQKGYCIFRIDDFEFQLEKPVTIWGVTFYNPQNTRKVKTSNPRTENIEIDFNHLIFPNPRNLINSTCNAIIKVDYRVIDRNKPIISIHHVLNKVDKALQVLKKIKLDFVNGSGYVSGKVSQNICVLTDYEYNYRGYMNIKSDRYTFKIDNYQKSVLNDVVKDINFYRRDKKLLDIYAYLCQAKTDELSFKFNDYWTVLAEANFPNDPKGFINECKRIFRNELQSRLFTDTKIFLNNSLCSGTIYLPESEYSLSEYISKKVGINIPQKQRFNAEKFNQNYEKLKNHVEFEFLNDVLEELDEYKNEPEEYLKKFDNWLENAIWSAYAERNLESHNNITTDYSLIKLKDELLYIGENFIKRRISN